MSARTRCSAALAAAVLAAMLAPAHASAEDAPARAGLGPEGSYVTVDCLTRQQGALRLALTLSNPAEGSLSLGELTPLGGPDGFSGVGVLDPETGRYASLQRAQECPCAQLPVFLRAGEQVSFAVEVGDPGGDELDVVFAAFQPVRDVPVEGDDAAQDAATGDQVSVLRPRSRSLLTRVEQGAVEVVGDEQVALDTDVLFAFGSAALTPAADADLDRAAAVLTAQPDRRVSVQGHTDSQGDDAFNQRLSEQRATAVREALAGKLGAGWTFDVQGFGESRPVAPETTETGQPYAEGQARNRRVELTVQP